MYGENRDNENVLRVVGSVRKGEDAQGKRS